jgi:hypothetical protein
MRALRLAQRADAVEATGHRDVREPQVRISTDLYVF